MLHTGIGRHIKMVYVEMARLCAKARQQLRALMLKSMQRIIHALLSLPLYYLSSHDSLLAHLHNMPIRMLATMGPKLKIGALFRSGILMAVDGVIMDIGRLRTRKV